MIDDKLLDQNTEDPVLLKFETPLLITWVPTAVIVSYLI